MTYRLEFFFKENNIFFTELEPDQDLILEKKKKLHPNPNVKKTGSGSELEKNPQNRIRPYNIQSFFFFKIQMRKSSILWGF